ncbi:MAG: hypothetical protein J5676_10800 [Bacteroidaceae bacterium]|nr:hypothetical protein [Bacteroidaceae bacterium]
MKKLLFLLCMIFAGCSGARTTGGYRYWEKLSNDEKSEILKSPGIDENVVLLYRHKIEVSDDDSTAALLEKLVKPTDDKTRVLYFYLFNEILKKSDGALAEMMEVYCFRFVNGNADFSLAYFKQHDDIVSLYISSIGYELLYNEVDISVYKQNLQKQVRSESAKEYLPRFFSEVERVYKEAKEEG